MEYTYQPADTPRKSRRFKRRPVSRKRARPVNADSVPVNEIVIGKSILARLGYWLLMRNARSTRASHNPVKTEKKPKVTRSVLRQNRKSSDLVSIVMPTGRKRVVRIANGQGAGAPRDVKHEERMQSDYPVSVSLAVPPTTAKTSRKTGWKNSQNGSGVRQINAASKKSADHGEKIFEQDLFVKTERNIAAAMKEARKGISAEQLVVRFGLSVPEAGLIASMRK